jgi:hypothetical protein
MIKLGWKDLQLPEGSVCEYSQCSEAIITVWDSGSGSGSGILRVGVGVGFLEWEWEWEYVQLQCNLL